jgi:predicted O-methyltransferase YrrM
MRRSRWEIVAGLVKDNKCRVIAEIGVDHGNTSLNVYTLCKDQIERIIMVDPVLRPDVDTFVQSHLDKCTFMKMKSEEAVKLIPDGYLDLVFIDANHEYSHIRKDIDKWIPKVKTGGIIAGHDYSDAHPGVKQAVKESWGDFELEIDFDRSEQVVAVWWRRKKE